MAISQDGRQFLNTILKLADSPEAGAARTGMKTTNVGAYPVFLGWGRWGGCELNASGNNKAFLFLPYLQSGPMPLQKYNGASAMETPLDMVMSEVPNPYNCKVTVTPALNISRLVEGEYYHFILAMKPAAVGNGNNPTPYWDAYLKAIGSTPNDVFKEYFALFNITKTHWAKIKLNPLELEEDEDEHEHPANGAG